MQNTQPKFKWHNEVIAWLKGETIEWKSIECDDWSETNLNRNKNIPFFYTDDDYTYRIKPKEVIKYAGIYEHPQGATMGEQEFETLEECVKQTRANSSKFQKRTYLNGGLIALELVKV